MRLNDLSDAKKWALLAGFVGMAAAAAWFEKESSNRNAFSPQGSEVAIDTSIQRAFEQRAQDVLVAGRGRVSKVLPDDNEGSRHQRFIVELEGGHTVLIAHNIDLAPRVAPLRPGDPVQFSGEYAWNAQGGVVHWTHLDPQGTHAHGWIYAHGRRFE